MRRIVVLVAGIIVFPAVLSAQLDRSWVNTYNGQYGPCNEAGRAVAVGADGYIYACGQGLKAPAGFADIITMKLDPATGEALWVRYYDGPAHRGDSAVAIAVDNTGGVYVTGYSRAANNYDDYVTVKYNAADGSQSWVARYDYNGGTDRPAAIAVDNSGGVYVTGLSYIYGTNQCDYATVRYNAAGGSQRWVASYNGPGNSTDAATAITVDNSGGVYVTGQSTGSGTQTDYATIKYGASDGSESWVARYNGTGNSYDRPYDIALDNSGGVYITGYSVGAGTGPDYLTVRYDAADGSESWVARYDGPFNDDDYAHAIALDNSGGVYVTGYSYDDPTGQDYATIKYDAADGSQFWLACYDGPVSEHDKAYDIAVDNSGGVYVTGYSRGPDWYDDYVTIKYDAADGSRTWLSRYDGPAGGHDCAKALALDAAGVYVTGYSRGSVYGYDYATVWYDRENGDELGSARHEGLYEEFANSVATGPLGTVYVTGYSQGVTSDILTAKYSFRPGKPVLLAPADGATGVPLAGDLDWEPALGAISYDVYLDQNYPPATLRGTVTEPTTTFAYEPYVAHLETYYWRVVARNAGGTAESSVWSFTTADPPPGWPEKWTETPTPIPNTAGDKAVKDGGWIVTGPDKETRGEVVYVAKGNKSTGFFKYYPLQDSWQSLEPIPSAEGTKNKPPAKGSVGVTAGNAIYMTKGNNTAGFWKYEIAGDTWIGRAPVPEGNDGKRVKGGNDMVYVPGSGDTGYVYLLKGMKTDFYKYNTATNTWETKDNAPQPGTRPKYDRGSFLAFDGTNKLIYAHPAKFNDGENHYLFRYDVRGDTWCKAGLKGMPFLGLEGGKEAKKKKVGDGAAGVCKEGNLYALKGGNTQGFFKYWPVGDSWTQLDTVPGNGSTGKKKRVKSGGDLTVYGTAFLALKGNKTFEVWRYIEPAAPMMATRPERDGVAAGRAANGEWLMALSPNPLSSGFATLRYSLPNAGPATVTVFDVAGRSVFSTRSPGHLTAGSLPLDLRKLSAGVYVVRLEALGASTTRKLVVLE